MPSIVELDKDNNVIEPEPKRTTSNANIDPYNNTPKKKMLILEDEYGNEITRIVPTGNKQENQIHQSAPLIQPYFQNPMTQSTPLMQQSFQNPLYIQPQIIPTYFVQPSQQIWPQEILNQKSAPTFVNEINSYKKTPTQAFVKKNTKKGYLKQYIF